MVSHEGDYDQCGLEIFDLIRLPMFVKNPLKVTFTCVKLNYESF